MTGYFSPALPRQRNVVFSSPLTHGRFNLAISGRPFRSCNQMKAMITRVTGGGGSGGLGAKKGQSSRFAGLGRVIQSARVGAHVRMCLRVKHRLYCYRGLLFVCQVGDILNHKSESHSEDLHAAALNDYSNDLPPHLNLSSLPPILF